jgi:hypothetical protein
MADNEQSRLLLQQNETEHAPLHVLRTPWMPSMMEPLQTEPIEVEQVELGQVGTETEPVAQVSVPEAAAFTEQLQRLADTMPYRQSHWGTAEALGWGVALLCLIGWGNLPLSIALGLFGMMAGKYKHLENRYLQSQAALDLAQYDSTWLGPLARALESTRPALRPVAAQLLLRVLPMVTVADFARLPAYQRSCLHRRLIPTEELDVPLAEAILTALETVGDAESLRYVERLAHGMATNSARRHLRSYAAVCMRHMGDRLQREAQGDHEATETVVPDVGISQQTGLPSQARWAVTQVETQLKLLQQEKRKRQQPGMRIGFLIASWCVIVPYCAVQTWQQFAEGNWPLGLLLSITTLLMTQLHRLCLSSRQTEAARKLAQHDDVRGIGPLAEALEWPDSDLQAVAVKALTRLLPRLQATDGTLLNAHQRGCLYRHLNFHTRSQPEFQLAILKALEQVGDAAAIPHVRKLAKRVALGRLQQQVRRAAQDCLPFLETRAEQRRVSQTLLRASSAAGTTPDMLLRPADSSHAAAPEQLLRATENGD